MSVQRYDYAGERMAPSDEGQYVRFEDYERAISDAQSKLDEQTPLIEKALHDLAAGAVEVREARNEVLRADTDARRAVSYAVKNLDLLREADEFIDAFLENASSTHPILENLHALKNLHARIDAALAKNPQCEAAPSAPGAFETLHRELKDERHGADVTRTGRSTEEPT